MFYADFMCFDQIIIELKAIEKLLPQHEAQIINYLKATKMPLGLLINFNEALLKKGLRRVVNGLPE